MKIFRKSPDMRLAVLILFMAFSPYTTQAATYHFDMTYSGAAIQLTLGSDLPAGTQLTPGDSFTLTLSTVAGMQFRALSDYKRLDGAAFFVLADAVRTANVTTTLLLEGEVQSQQIQNGVSQSFVHMGTQELQISGGTVFDQINIDYTLLSATETTTIQSTSWILGLNPFFLSPHQIAFEAKPPPVPLPLSWALLGSALGLFGVRRALPLVQKVPPHHA